MKKLTRHKFAFLITLIVIIGLIGSTGYLIYNLSLLKDIENVLRLGTSIALFVVSLLLIILALKCLKKYKRIKLFILILLMIALTSGELFASYNVGKIYGTIEKVTKTSGYTTYSTSLVTLKNNKASSLKDIKGEKLGILEDESSIEGYVIPKEIIKKKSLSNETENYSSFISMIDDLKKGEINYIFLPTNYPIMFGSMDGYENIKDETKIIYTQTKKVKKDAEVSNTKPITEPFTVLIMGVDSEKEGIADGAFNGDSLIVVTFNPKTLTTTMLSIPRDSYVPIACFSGQRKNKITHAAWQGESCMEKTIENFLDINIDYYVKINFKGVVELVDNLGGVEVDVPYDLCEQNSNREWGKNTVYIEKGHQTLNGEQALAFSRNRHSNPGMCAPKWTNYNSSDFVRGQHQQQVIMSLMNKFKSVNSLDQVHNLLDTISNNMNTNMSTQQILSLYNVFKDISKKAEGSSDMADLLGIQKLYLNGHDQRIYDYGGTNLSLYNYVLYDDSIKAVSDAMKENLGIKKAKPIKKFSFNINNPYEEIIIGKDKTSKISLTLLPNFIGQSLSYVNSFCGSHGIKVNASGSSGTVTAQSVPAGANVEDVHSITITLSGGAQTQNKTTENKANKETSKEDKEDTTGSDTGDGSSTGDGQSGGNNPSGGSSSENNGNQPDDTNPPS
ncbi:MAG: LCP family protein [Bacilli bacterium]|nr:LCP family protein [Bacilli bacterium]